VCGAAMGVSFGTCVCHACVGDAGLSQEDQSTSSAKLPMPISAFAGPCFAEGNDCSMPHARASKDCTFPPPEHNYHDPYEECRYDASEEVSPLVKMLPSEMQQWQKETSNIFGSARRGAPDIMTAYTVESETLGAGAYGVCFKAHCKSNGEVRAVKMIPRTSRESLRWGWEEVRIMKLLNHPNIITLHETFEDVNAVYIVMELCAGEGLVNKLNDGGHFTEHQAKVLMLQILKAVEHIHNNWICHRDLKPDNFLLLTLLPLERNTLKLIDFGMSCTFEQGEFLRTRAGTPSFTAPEVLKAHYTERCDIWSAGVMLFLFLCGELPFQGGTIDAVFEAVEYGNFKFIAPAWKKVTEDAKDLVRGCLTYDPEQRLTASKACAQMNAALSLQPV